MNFKKLLPISLLSLGMLIGCGGSNTPAKEPFPDEKQDGSHVVEVTNLADLQKEWFDDGEPRSVTVTITEDGKPQNVAQAIAKKNLKLIVQDDSVFGTAGLSISPKVISEKTKTTKIAVKYFDTVKHIELTSTHRKTPKEYGAQHAGTKADPLTNEDALLVAKAQKAEGSYADVEYYIGGTVASFYHAPGSRSDKICSWFLKPAQSGGEKFEIYSCKKTDGTQWTNDDIWKGAYTVAHGKFADYNGQYETSSAILDSVTGEKPGPQQTIQATVAEALRVGKALDDGDSTYDFYEVTGYVVKKDGTNFFLSDTQEEAADVKDMLELYRVGTDDQPKMLKNAKIKAKINLKNYHGQVEDSGTMEITVLEPGEEWPSVKPEPAMVTGKTIAEFMADASGKFMQLYELTGKITRWSNKNDGTPNENATKYGNFYLSDDEGTTELLVYGATATASALVWSSADGKYVFTNPQDFLTNEATKDLAIGDEVKIRLTRCDYIKDESVTIEGCGIVMPKEAPTSKYGTEENPLTVEEAHALLDEENPTLEHVYVKGTVSKKVSVQDGRHTFWLSSSDGATEEYFEIYSAYLKDGLSADDLVVGVQVVCEGPAKIYVKGDNKTYELTSVKLEDNTYVNPYVLSITTAPASKYGTEEAPLTVEQAHALLDEENPALEHVYVKGTVSKKVSVQDGRHTFWLSSSDGATEEYFEIYSAYLKDGLNAEDLQPGAVVVCEGPAKIYVKGDNKTYELTSVKLEDNTYVNPYVLSIVPSPTPAPESDVKLEGGETSYSATVKVGETSYDAIKVGKDGFAGNMMIKVKAGKTKVIFHAAAWKNKTAVLAISATGADIDLTSATLNPDNGISGNSPFTLEGDEANFALTINFTNPTGSEIVVTLATSDTANGRFVVWNAVAE